MYDNPQTLQLSQIMAFLQSAHQARIAMSSREMLAISLAISREFAPRFTKADSERSCPVTFSAQELLAISQEISREFGPRPIENRSSLVLLPIDPRRLHAYWHFADHNLNTASKPVSGEQKSVSNEQKTVVEEQLILRVFKQSKPLDKTADWPEKPNWFDIPIDRVQRRQDIVLPNDTSTICSTYSAAIGVSHGEQDFIALAYSNTAAIPNPTVNPDNSGPDVMAQFIMPHMNASSSLGKAVPHQEITESR